VHTRRSVTLGLLGAGLVGACTTTTGTSGRTASSSSKTLLPTSAWDCGLPGGIAPPESGTLVLEAEVDLDAVYNVGRTPYGMRRAAVTQSGPLKGPRIEGEVLPGGLDYELTLANGVVEVEQILVLKTSDGGHVLMRNAGTGPDASDLRVVYDFEAPGNGPFGWLNSGTYVGRRSIDAAAKKMRLSIYDVSSVPVDAAQAVRIQKPAGVPPQPWDFRHADPSEQRGEEILVEVVTLGRGQSIQGGKRGNRNVLPITGGTLTGIVSGKIVFGGADYQSLGNTGAPPIDARYMWETPEGDIIIVRNTTNAGIGLVPFFETRVDGKYAWLNSGKYLSSPPGMGPGGLTISMYKSK
jgi:hypothetical protein